MGCIDKTIYAQARQETHITCTKDEVYTIKCQFRYTEIIQRNDYESMGSMNKSIAHVLDDGIRLYRDTFSPLFSTVLLFSLMSYSFYLIQHPSSAFASVSFWLRTHPFTWIGFQSFMLTLLALTILHYQSAVFSKEEASVSNALQESFRKLPAALLYFVLIALLGLSATLPLLDAQYQESLFLINSVCSLLILLYLVPLPGLLVKNSSGVIETLKRSITIVQGRWFRTAMILLMILFIYTAMLFSVSTLGLFILSFLPVTITRPDLLQMALQLVLATFFGGFLYSGYLALVYDLDARVDSLKRSDLS